MRTLAIVGATLVFVGAVVYWKRDALENWLSDFASDRLVHAIETPDTTTPDQPGVFELGIEAFGMRLAKDTGRKTLAKLDPKLLAQKVVGL